MESRIRKSSTELLYRGFLTEGVKALTKNTAKFGGDVMSLNFIEFVGRKEHRETRTPGEIIENIKAGLDALGESEE